MRNDEESTRDDSSDDRDSAARANGGRETYETHKVSREQRLDSSRQGAHLSPLTILSTIITCGFRGEVSHAARSNLLPR